MRTSRVWRAVIGGLLFLACAPGASSAQYFGRNKVQYRTFDFQILKTAHFDLYYYPEEQDAAEIGVAPGRALVRAPLALLRPPAPRPAGADSVRRAGALPADQRDRRPDWRGHRRRHRSLQTPHRPPDGGDTRRHRPCHRTRAGARVPVRHHGRGLARRPGRRARHPAVPPLVRRRDGGVSLARAGRRADGDVDARRGAQGEAAQDRGSRETGVFPVPLGPRLLGVHRREVRRPRRGVARAIRREPAFRSAGPRAPARHRARSAERRLAPVDPAGRRSRAGRTAGARERGAPRHQPDERRRPVQHRTAHQPGRPHARVLLGARPVLDRPVPGRREDGSHRAEAGRVRHRSALRQPAVPELGRGVESRRAAARADGSARRRERARAHRSEERPHGARDRAARPRRCHQPRLLAGRTVGRAQREPRRLRGPLPALARHGSDGAADARRVRRSGAHVHSGWTVHRLRHRAVHERSRRRSRPGPSGWRGSRWPRAKSRLSRPFSRASTSARRSRPTARR